MTSRPDANALLALWERTLEQGTAVRADALLRAASDGATDPRTLGERNARLLTLHAQLFGRELALLSRCPACGATAQFEVDCDALAAQAPLPAAAAPQRLEAHGHTIEFRLPDGADLAAVTLSTDDTGTAGDAAFIGALLERCVLACWHGSAQVPVQTLPAPVLDALSQRMDALDPAASLSFDIECPQCVARWDVRLEVGPLVWQKLQAAAERVLLDVDALARAYGWTEPDVLRLSPVRRAAYLQLAVP